MKAGIGQYPDTLFAMEGGEEEAEEEDTDVCVNVTYLLMADTKNQNGYLTKAAKMTKINKYSEKLSLEDLKNLRKCMLLKYLV